MKLGHLIQTSWHVLVKSRYFIFEKSTLVFCFPFLRGVNGGIYISIQLGPQEMGCLVLLQQGGKLCLTTKSIVVLLS